MNKSYPRVYFELILMSGLLIMGNGLLGSFLSIFAKQMDPIGIMAGFVISAWYFFRTFIELPSGMISNRVGRPRLIFLGLVLSLFGSILCALANSIYLLMIGRTLWGLGTGFYFLNSTALVIDLFDRSVVGRALGMFQSMEFLGDFMGQPIGAFMADSLGQFTPVFYASVGLILFAFFLGISSKNLKNVSREKEPTTNISVKEVFPLLKNWGILVICICSLVRMLIMQGIKNTVFSLYIKEQIGLSVGLIGVFLSSRAGGHILATVTGGYLSDKIGGRPLVLIGTLIESMSIFMYTIVRSFELFLLSSLFEGFGGGLIFTCLIVLLNNTVPNRLRAVAIGLYRTTMDVGGFAGPIVLLFAYSNLGATSPFLISATLLIVTLILMATTRSRKVEKIS